MFDGNYRTSQRTISLSGRQRKTSAATSTRASILETSRRQRQERVLREAQIKASVCVQRHVRGFLTRRRVIRDLELALETTAPLEEFVRRLNARLRPVLVTTRPPKDTSLSAWLNKMASGIQMTTTTPATRPLAPFILQTILERIRLHKYLSLSVVTTLFDYCVTLSASNQQLSAEHIWKRIGGLRGYLQLLETLQVLMTGRHESNGDGRTLALLLWKTLVTSTPADQSQAVVCALLMSQPNVFDVKSTPLLAWRDVGDDSLSALYQHGVQALVTVLASTTNKSDPLVAAVQTMYKRHQAIMLMNVLDLYDALTCDSVPGPTPLMLLLEQSMRQSPTLTLLCSLVAKGENIQQLLVSTGATQVTNVSSKMEQDDGDSDDDEDYEAGRVRDGMAPSSGNRTGRLTRTELQTMTKLNRIYSQLVDKWQAETLLQVVNGSDDDKTVLVQLATRIGRPDLWLRWGATILAQNSDSEQGRQAYVYMLSSLLQTCTGLVPRQSSTNALLTKLAFQQDFLEKLWRYVLFHVNNHAVSNQTMYTALSVFSDVFSHCLIALRDDQFLAQFTYMQGPRVILAEAVITQLRDLLYDMYWSRPVQANSIRLVIGTSMSADDALEGLRARLFLVGTKLWNSLYERWCRLVRMSPFCSESTWLFPSMASLSSDSAVAAPSRRDADDASMDIDSDSDNDELMSAADEENEHLADAFGDPKMARILTCIPQALPFERRVRLFDALLRKDKATSQDESAEMRAAMLSFMHGGDGGTGSRERIAVHRENLYDDAMRQLNSLGPKLRRKVQVTFTNQLGALEAGIDGGGVFKEFIDDLITDAFVGDEKSTAAHRLFKITPLETLAVNTDLMQVPDLLEHYEFCGRVLGKAIYESILVEPQFCLPFLNLVLGKSNSLEDLKNYDPEIYDNLTKLLTASADQIAAMGLTFELDIGTGRSMRTVELVRGGSSVAVTKQNAISYVHLVANQRLNVETSQVTKAFLRGFRDLIPASWVRLFSAYELQKLISGDDSVKSIDVASLKATMQYAAGYHPSQPIMQWFWQVIEEFNTDQQRKFLKFMTSCSRQPLLGFSSMTPAPCVQQIRLPENMLLDNPERTAPLPTSSTCMNLLKLPNYGDKELLRKKLLAAIESGAGFELT